MTASSLTSFVAGLPKAELHVHQVGSASPRIVAQLAERHPGVVPSDPEALAADLLTAVLDAEPRPAPAWAPGEVPDDVRALLGSWWAEGSQFLVEWRDGGLTMAGRGGKEWRRTRFVAEGPDRWRAVAGRERGELLRVERADRLRFAGYAYTRDVGTAAPEAGTDLQARMFTPRMTEDPATGSATAAATALLAEVRGGDLRLRVGQGVDMGRPSLLLARAGRQGSAMIACVGGRCVAAMEGSFQLPGP